MTAGIIYIDGTSEEEPPPPPSYCGVCVCGGGDLEEIKTGAILILQPPQTQLEMVQFGAQTCFLSLRLCQQAPLPPQHGRDRGGGGEKEGGGCWPIRNLNLRFHRRSPTFSGMWRLQLSPRVLQLGANSSR